MHPLRRWIGITPQELKFFEIRGIVLEISHHDGVNQDHFRELHRYPFARLTWCQHVSIFISHENGRGSLGAIAGTQHTGPCIGGGVVEAVVEGSLKELLVVVVEGSSGGWWDGW